MIHVHAEVERNIRCVVVETHKFIKKSGGISDRA